MPLIFTGIKLFLYLFFLTLCVSVWTYYFDIQNINCIQLYCWYYNCWFVEKNSDQTSYTKSILKIKQVFGPLLLKLFNNEKPLIQTEKNTGRVTRLLIRSYIPLPLFLPHIHLYLYELKPSYACVYSGCLARADTWIDVAHEAKCAHIDVSE